MEAFGRLAAETRAMEALGPPLAESNPRLRVPPEALYFCAGDQTGESLTVLALNVLAGLRVSRCCPLPSAFMT